MKLKWLLWLTLAALAGAACFGVFKRGSYTDISGDDSYLEEIYVAQIPESFALMWCEELEESLPSAPYIARVTALDDIEYLGGTGRQLVKVEKVYQGTDLGEGQEIYITCSRGWSLQLFTQPHSIERAFVNVMETGEEYLLFMEGQIDGLGEPTPVYQLYAKTIAPVFSYREHDNRISEEMYPNSTYVRYREVRDNEFFAKTQAAMDALIELKNEMIERYN